MATPEVTAIYNQHIQHLSRAERQQLLEVISRNLVDDESQTAKPPRSIMELHGLGKELWQGIDAQRYVNHLRDEWGSQQLHLAGNNFQR